MCKDGFSLFTVAFLVRLRPEHSTGRPGSGRAEKTLVFRVEKILPMVVPWDVTGQSFRAWGGPPRIL
jgi:hypothetical protein